VFLRQWLGLLQAEMATKLGMTVHAYRAYERWHPKWKDPSFTMRASSATDVSIDWLWVGVRWGGPPSRVPLTVAGASMRPVLRVVSGREARG